MASSCTKNRGDGGCSKRRCAKADNNNEKVCTADGVTCSLDECQAKCASYNGFECAFYAHDAAVRSRNCTCDAIESAVVVA